VTIEQIEADVKLISTAIFKQRPDLRYNTQFTCLKIIDGKKFKQILSILGDPDSSEKEIERRVLYR